VPVLKVLKEQSVLKEHQELLVLLGQQDHKDLLDLPDLPERMDQLDLLGQLDHVGRKEILGVAEIKENHPIQW